MAVFRVEKTRGYTVMSNDHLKNRALSLKAKGLLCVMLSLPDDWDYTLKGLAHISRESIDAIRTTVLELEKAGYIARRQGRDAKGRMTAIEYTIYEQPQNCLEPLCDSPILGTPTSENPISDCAKTHQTIESGNKKWYNKVIYSLFIIEKSNRKRENAKCQWNRKSQ